MSTHDQLAAAPGEQPTIQRHAPNTRTRRLLWLASVIVAFILGYLLARRKCEDTAESGGVGTTAVVARGGPSEATPGHIKLGGGQGTATSKGGKSGNLNGGVDTANGGGAKGGGGDADAGNGGGSGSIPAGSGEFKKVPTLKGTSDSADITGLAGRTANGRANLTDSTPPDPAARTLTARDFTYDSTALPRYPNTTQVASAFTTRTDSPRDTATSAVIVTNDSFDTVVAWYHSHLPTTWHQTVIGDMRGLATQLSAENIAKMIGQAVNGGAPPASTPPPAASGPNVSVATWTAPDDDPSHNRGVMVAKTYDGTTRIIMKRSVRP